MIRSLILDIFQKLNSPSCPKCGHQVALDPANEEDTRSLFDDKLFCVQNVQLSSAKFVVPFLFLNSY